MGHRHLADYRRRGVVVWPVGGASRGGGWTTRCGAGVRGGFHCGAGRFDARGRRSHRAALADARRRAGVGAGSVEFIFPAAAFSALRVGGDLCRRLFQDVGRAQSGAVLVFLQRARRQHGAGDSGAQRRAVSGGVGNHEPGLVFPGGHGRHRQLPRGRLDLSGGHASGRGIFDCAVCLAGARGRLAGFCHVACGRRGWTFVYAGVAGLRREGRFFPAARVAAGGAPGRAQSGIRGDVRRADQDRHLWPCADAADSGRGAGVGRVGFAGHWRGVGHPRNFIRAGAARFETAAGV